jgi:hypothetical protein
MMTPIFHAVVATALLTVIPSFFLAFGLSTLFVLGWSFPQMVSVWLIAMSVNIFLTQVTLMRKMSKQ